MASYDIRLLDVTVTVISKRGPGPTFEALVKRGGDLLGRGEDWTEPGAVGLAVLAARNAFETCNGCGQTFDRAELRQDDAGLWYCGDCVGYGHWQTELWR